MVKEATMSGNREQNSRAIMLPKDQPIRCMGGNEQWRQRTCNPSTRFFRVKGGGEKKEWPEP